jgi:hypothetical protein
MKKVKFIDEYNNTSINMEIPNYLLKIITDINQIIFKYIKDNYNEIKIIEKKLSIISDNINNILTKEKSDINNLTKSEKILIKSFKKNDSNRNYDYKDITCSSNEVGSNNYLIFKLKKKLKQEHENNKIKELKFLERIAVLQSKLNLYEKSFEQLIIDNNIPISKKEKNNYIDNEENKKVHFPINKLNNEKHKKQKNIYRPFSNLNDRNINEIKKNIFENQSINESGIRTYISANLNKEIFFNRNKNFRNSNSLNNINYRYYLGNNYLRNDFRQIKKTIHENNKKISNLRIIANKFHIDKSYE